MDSKEDSGKDEERLVSPYQTQLRRRCVALGFQRLTHEGEPDYVDMFDGGRAANPNPFHEKDLAEWNNGKALGKMGTLVGRHIWKLSKIANLPEQTVPTDEQHDEQKAKEDPGLARNERALRDSVIDNVQEGRKDERRQDPERRPPLMPGTNSSPARDRMEVFEFGKRGPAKDLGPTEAVSPSRTLGLQDDIPNQSNLRGRWFDPADRRRDSLMHTGLADMENRGRKRQPSSGREQSTARTPQCFRCWGAGQECSGSERCDACQAAGTRMCVYKHCGDGLACRDSRCPYVHPRQIPDESHYTIGFGSLGERDAAFKSKSRDPRGYPRRVAVCVRCWRTGHWCTQGKQCTPCQDAQVRCVYKACYYKMGCASARCIYMHPDQYDSHDPSWGVEEGDIGPKNVDMGNNASSPDGRRQTNDVLHRKAICRNCFKTAAFCDFGDKCRNCQREGVSCIRVWCDRDRDCLSARCPAVHSGQFGEGAIVEKGTLEPPKHRFGGDSCRP